MSTEIEAIRSAILAGAPGEDIEGLPLPAAFRAAVVRADEQTMFEGEESEDKDPRASLHIDDVALPELAPDEAIVAVMASSINFNTVWTSIFEPLPTFQFLKRLGKESVWGARHDQPFHVVGSDAAGVVLRVGSAVREWKPGAAVTVHCNYVDDQDPSSHDDAMMAANQRIWGFESNYGGLAEIALVKANQLMPKPAHLTWEESAVNALTNSTSYRMIVSPNGSQMTQGQTVLIWGAGGGIGAYAVQYVLNGGGRPVGVVSSPERAALLHELGCEAVIDRKAEEYRFWSDEHTQDPAEWRRFGKKIRELAGTDPDIVFEHPGRQTMGASVFVAKRGGMIITCAATSGFTIEYDNRYLWMNLKTIKGCHFANYREAWEANRLICEGKIHPTLSAVYSLDDVGEAAYQVHHNLHEGKLGILVLAPEEGLGVTDTEMRDRLLPQITLFRRHA
jgi:crotonyl-CoA reductase